MFGVSTVKSQTADKKGTITRRTRVFLILQVVSIEKSASTKPHPLATRIRQEIARNAIRENTTMTSQTGLAIPSGLAIPT